MNMNTNTVKQNQPVSVKPFGIKDKFGYMFGDFGNDFTFVLASSFLMKFYTDVMGVPAAVIGLMMFSARFVDAFTDIAMGQIVDRSPITAKGKFRPWIRRMAGPIALSSFLMYANWIADMSMTIKIVWMFVTYILWCSICYSGMVIPYGSMASAITSDSTQRTALSNWRSIGGTLAMTFISVALPLFVYYTDSNGHKVLSGSNLSIAALCCSIGAFICYLLCYALTTERVHQISEKKEKFAAKKLLASLISNRCLKGIVAVVILREVANTGIQGMSAYIYPNYFNNPLAQAQSGIIGTVIMLVMSMFIVKLTERTGKKELIILGSFITAGILVVAYFVHTHNVYIWLGVYGIAMVGNGFFGLVGWALVGDITDDTEVLTKERSDGTIYSIYSFSRKVGQACSSVVTGLMLTGIGYTVKTAYDTNVIDNIYNVTCIIPAIGFVIMALVMLFAYPLNKKTVLSNSAVLEQRVAEKDND